jgi:hypothetical protein
MTTTVAASNTTQSAARLVDHSALRVNQACIIALLVIAFLFDLPWLVALVGLVMLVGTIWPKAGLFKLFYSRVLRPAGLVRPAPQPDEAQPHLFAQGLGAVVLAAATVALWSGAAALGWLLVWLVVVLAGANLFLGFCAGCSVYYQLARRGLRPDLPAWRQG